jgi:transcriptional regulator with XRE-family HTH domain
VSEPRPSGDYDSVQALTAAVQAQPDQPVNNLTSKYTRLKLSDIELILRLQAEGCTHQQIADVVKCSRSTVTENLQRIKDAPNLLQALAKAESVPMLQRWIRASKTAAKRGDHRPAREFIELAAPELRPQQGNSGAGGWVTINIGMPGAPIQLPVIEVQALDRQGLSPRAAITAGEGVQKDSA